MTFTIDTGTDYEIAYGHLDTGEIIMDVASDLAGEGATPEEIAIRAVPMIVGKLWRAKKPETVRAQLLKMWPIIAPMAHTAPDSFDAILTEFAERANDFR